MCISADHYTHPPDLAVTVYDLLLDFHFAHGRWAEALAAQEAEVALLGESEDPNNVGVLCRALLCHGPVAVDRSAYSRIRVLCKNAHVPFSVNGRPYHGYLDTAANISLLSESAAKQLGLPMESAKFRFGGTAGNGLDHHCQRLPVAVRRLGGRSSAAYSASRCSSRRAT